MRSKQGSEKSHFIKASAPANFYPKLAENTRRFEKTEKLTKDYEIQYVVVVCCSTILYMCLSFLVEGFCEKIIAISGRSLVRYA
ncbi:MAG: hypothetical protein KKD63_15125 [Proteobacteria bacterium]|nr:hypothetical protein [Desulfobulbaceae bacterium]MBU4154200.1 hypothetical protein [Pseudomonadota bacterium]